MNHIASYIDALIPGVIGVLLITSPRIFTKVQGEAFDQTKKKLKAIGGILVAIGCVLAAMTFANT